MAASKTFKEFIAIVLAADLSDLRLVQNDFLLKSNPARGSTSIQGDFLDAWLDGRLTVREARRVGNAVQDRLNNSSDGMCTIKPDLRILSFTFPMTEEATDGAST